MFCLTHQERKVLLSIGIVILGASVFRFIHNHQTEKNTVEYFERSDNVLSYPVNINTATRIHLENIPGIGQTIAERILEYRENNGPFKEDEDLKAVKGIGDKKLEAIKSYIIF
jgi:comEA protein